MGDRHCFVLKKCNVLFPSHGKPHGSKGTNGAKTESEFTQATQVGRLPLGFSKRRRPEPCNEARAHEEKQMPRTREVGTLWIGGPLSWLEQLCLKSFVDKGSEDHAVQL